MLGTILLRIVVIFAGVSAVTWCAVFYTKLFKNPSLMKQNPVWDNRPKTAMAIQGAILFIAMFFDTLGIGGNAPIAAMSKITKTIPDKLIPGSCNTNTLVGSCTETILFVSMVAVDPITLVCFITAVTLGTRIGAGFVSRMPVKPIRIILGFGLTAIGVVMILRNLGMWPGGGMEIGLTGWRLILATVIAFVIGLLAAAGIGGYAFMIATCYGLGMDPRSAFPIMFGSYSFLMLFGGLKFLKEDALDYRSNAIGQITSCLGVLTAFFIVREMPLNVLFWVIDFVVFYGAANMLWTGFRTKPEKTEEVEAAPAE